MLGLGTFDIRAASTEERARDSRAALQPADTAWAIQCVDCPKHFNSMGNRSLRMDSASRPHVAYGGDRLYYACYDGASWQIETVDDTPDVGDNPSFGGSICRSFRSGPDWSPDCRGSGPVTPSRSAATLAQRQPAAYLCRRLQFGPGSIFRSAFSSTLFWRQPAVHLGRCQR